MDDLIGRLEASLFEAKGGPVTTTLDRLKAVHALVQQYAETVGVSPHDQLSCGDTVKSLAIALLSLANLQHEYISTESVQRLVSPVVARVGPVKLSPSFCTEFDEHSATLCELKKDLTKEIDDDSQNSIDSNAVFSWGEADEQCFQRAFAPGGDASEAKLSSTDDISEIPAHNDRPEVNPVLSSFESRNAQFEGETASLKRQIKHLQIERDDLLARLERKREKLKAARQCAQIGGKAECKRVQFVSENQKALNDAQLQIRQMEETQLTMRIEKKLADSKIKTLEERLERERSQAETQKSLAKFATETEIHSRVAQFREELLDRKSVV
jgi:hypothetical protein